MRGQRGCINPATLAFDHEQFRPLVTSDGFADHAVGLAGEIVDAVRITCLAGATEKCAVAARIHAIVIVNAAAGGADQLDDTTLHGAVDVAANPRQFELDFRAWLAGVL